MMFRPLVAALALASCSDGHAGDSKPTLDPIFLKKLNSDFNEIFGCLRSYQFDFKQCPKSLEDLVDSDLDISLDKLPTDPWGNEYFYKPSTTEKDFVVGTYGADGLPGGEGINADINMFNLWTYEMEPGNESGPIHFSGNEFQIEHDISGLVIALLRYRGKYFRYPESLQGVVEFLPDFRMDKIPVDPWGIPYFYEKPYSNGDYIIGTFGADGKPGGEGDDADITNLTLQENG